MATTIQERQLENTRLREETEKLNHELEERIVARTAQLETSNTKLLESQAELRKLSQQLMHVIEQERTRIAREIHDQLGQVLTAIKIELGTTQRRLDPGQTLVFKKLADVIYLVDETIQVVRRIASDMRPGILDDFGLAAAAEWQLEEFEKLTGLHCHLSAQVDEKKLDPELCTASFRILQEALTNVARHAKATEVHVTLETTTGSLILTVQDNGRGISEDEQHHVPSLGLLGMHERAMQFGGTVNLAGMAGKGTCVTLTLPLRTSQQDASR